MTFGAAAEESEKRRRVRLDSIHPLDDRPRHPLLLSKEVSTAHQAPPFSFQR